MKAMISKVALGLTALGAIVLGGSLFSDEPAAGAAGFDVAQLFAAERASSAGPNGGGQNAPAPADAPKPIPTAGYDSALGGFFIQDPTGTKFRLNFNGRIQARYTYFGKDEQGESVAADAGNDEDESYFELERARIGLSGFFWTEKLKFKVEFDGETDASDKGSLTDTYISYKANKALTAGIGQFKPYFIREEATSSGRQLRVDRSLANEFFNIDRNVGVWLEGYLDPDSRLYYNAAVTNGIDTVNIAPGGGGTHVLDQHPAFVGKLDYAVLGEHKDSYSHGVQKISDKALLVMGGSFVHEQYDPRQASATTFVSTRGEVTSIGLDAIYKYRRMSVGGDYMGRWYDRAADSSGSLYAHGFTVQGGVLVCEDNGIELTMRYSAIFGNEGADNGKAVEIGPGINWYFSKSHNGKVQLDVAWVDISNDLPVQTENLRQAAGNAAFGSTASGFAEGEQGVLTRFQVQIGF